MDYLVPAKKLPIESQRSLESVENVVIRENALQVIGVTRGSSIFNDMPDNIYDDMPEDTFRDIPDYVFSDMKQRIK